MLFESLRGESDLAAAGEVIILEYETYRCVLTHPRLFDQTPPPALCDFENLAKRTADAPLAIPRALPAQVRPQTVARYDDTPVYPRKRSYPPFLVSRLIFFLYNAPECITLCSVVGD